MFNIALNTFREIIRNRFFSLIIFLSVLLIVLSLGLDSLALGENRRVIVDFGLSFLEISGVMVILFLGGGLITREIEGRTIYLILSKPIARPMIVFGKFLGFIGVLSVVVLVESLILSFIFYMQGVFLDSIMLVALLCIFGKLVALLALILFFSVSISPSLALFMTLASYIIGHGGYALLEYAERTQGILYQYIAKCILTLFPNLESLNLKNLIQTSAHIDLHIYILSFLSSMLYSLIILGFAGWIFHKRSFDSV